MKNNKESKNCFLGIHCIDGSCPKALANEHNNRDDDTLLSYEGMENLKCRDCYYHYDDCSNCYFYQTKMCEKEV